MGKTYTTLRDTILARDIINDIEHPETSAAGELIVDEIQRPTRIGIGIGLDQDRRTRADGPSSSFPFANG